MTNLQDLELPKLMVDDSEKDGHAEIVMDYIISWTLRNADVKHNGKRPILYGYCREILATLLGVELDDDTIFERVEVWKQEQKIDLWVELNVKRGDAIERHAILVEDKYYDNLRYDESGRCQLEIYKERFDRHYAVQSEEWHKHYLVISCIERTDPKFENFYSIAPILGFKTFSFYEIFGKNRLSCESDIFNEFWINW